VSAQLPLAGMRIVEAARGVAGPLAACRLGDLGADVVKVEWREGDWTRGCPPFLADGTSSTFFALNRGKQGVLVDASVAGDRAMLRRVLERADVFVTDLSTAELDALGLHGVDAEVCPWHERLVVAQISALGRNGPLAGKAGSELGAQAMAGYTRYVGTRGEPAVRLGADVAGCGTGIFAAQAVLAALFSRRRSGRGQRVDLSLLNSLLSMKTVHLAAQSDPDAFEGPRVGGAYDPPERGWKTGDKPITFAFGGAVGAEGRPGWTQFVEAMGLMNMLDDPRYDKNGRLTTGLGPKAREFKAEYEAGFVKHSADEVVAAVREYGGFASAYLTHDELMREPQVAALDIVRQVEEHGASVPVLDFPVRFSVSSTRLNGNAPRLGEHTELVAASLAAEARPRGASP
jgi:crotonobetainyl-CoA:carnitine CoA-transferase CaiB-like acyl-CoA transferase